MMTSNATAATAAVANRSVLEQFPYLDQEPHVLFNSSSVFARMFNVQYKTGRSLVSSIAQRFKTAPIKWALASKPDSSEELDYSDIVWTLFSYFLSGYAAACLLVAVILNRLVTMSTLSSRNQQYEVAPWARIGFHAFALMTLAYILYQTGAQMNIYGVPNSTASYLRLSYGIVCLSHCIETFMATTSNMKPLEESDYSLFGLSKSFYYMTSMDAPSEQYIYTCLACFLGRFIIHFVEIFKIRRYRFILSMILNVSYSLCLLFVWQTGIEIITSPLTFLSVDQTPKILSTLIVVLSYFCFQLSCWVRLGQSTNTSERISRAEDLQYYSFFSNLSENLNLSGEEEYYQVVMKAAVMLCNPKQSKKNGVHRQFEDVPTPTSLHKSYLISGYMNKIDEPPLQQLDFKRDIHPTSVWKLRLSWYISMARNLSDWVKYLWKGDEEPVQKRGRDQISFNDFVTENNYRKFLHSNDKRDSNKYLLPEEDYTDDYLPPESEPDDEELETEDEEEEELYEIDEEDSNNSAIESDGTTTGYIKNEGQVTVAQELFNSEQIQELIRSPQEMSWYLSTWSIMNFEAVNKCGMLTRRGFARNNEYNILQEVIKERRQEPHSHTHDVNEETVDMTCVVCKINTRNIIFWPCKCFAICEGCRSALGLRGYTTCICCRSEVSGYSKLNVV